MAIGAKYKTQKVSRYRLSELMKFILATSATELSEARLLRSVTDLNVATAITIPIRVCVRKNYATTNSSIARSSR